MCRMQIPQRPVSTYRAPGDSLDIGTGDESEGIGDSELLGAWRLILEAFDVVRRFGFCVIFIAANLNRFLAVATLSWVFGDHFGFCRFSVEPELSAL